jgi:hypothetical protein
MLSGRDMPEVNLMESDAVIGAAEDLSSSW